jgi:hypothetical protein
MVERAFFCAILLAGLGNLCGCIPQQGAIVSTNTPHAYADGFDDGCHSGNKAGGSLFEQFQKDSGRFVSDALYAQGWSDGFRQCETALESVQRETRVAMEQQRWLQQKHPHDIQQPRHLEQQLLRGFDTAAL